MEIILFRKSDIKKEIKEIIEGQSELYSWFSVIRKKCEKEK